MLDIKLVRENVGKLEEGLRKRNASIPLDGFLKAEERRREVLRKVEELRGEKNTVSEQIGKWKRELPKNPYDNNYSAISQAIQKHMDMMKGMSNEIKSLEVDLKTLEDETIKFLMTVPNIPHSSVPVGINEESNEEVRRFGKLRDFDFTPLNHWDVGERLGIIDFDRASRMSGARFAVMLGAGARLERAIMNFMLDHNTALGYKEVFPPILVNRAAMTGTGQLPKFEAELFRVADPEFYLIPTAEVPVTNLHREEILEEKALPIYYTAYTPCFRREAGSYGKDTRGLIRQHQFNKVELVKFVRPEDSYAELEKLTADAEDILQKLGLPYRTMALCTGDMGFSSAKTYDLEVWLPGQGKYREISSCSNFEDFQARRASIRFKREGKKGTEFVHTLNGSGLAIGRTLVAVLENYQQKDGSVVVPDALRPYMGTDIIKPA